MRWPALLLVGLAGLWSSGAWALELEVRGPGQSGFSSQTSWGLQDLALIADSETLYVALRRTQGWQEQGRLLKVTLNDNDGQWTLRWSQALEGQRRLLVAPLSGGVFAAGELVSVPWEEPELQDFMGLDQDEWMAFQALSDSSVWGAPRSLVAVGATETFPSRRSMIYGHCSDGVLSALDATTGRELWAFLAPSVLGYPRMKRALTALPEEPLPWLTEGFLSAEDVVLDGQSRTLLWGPLGQGGRGLYCLDVTDPEAPRYLWCREDLSQGQWTFDGRCQGTAELGFTEGPGLAFPLGDGRDMILGTGEGQQGRLLWLDSTSGTTLWTSQVLEGEVTAAPAAFCNAQGDPEILLVHSGAVLQGFLVEDQALTASGSYRAGTGLTFQGSPAAAWLRQRRFTAVLARSESQVAVTALEVTLKDGALTLEPLWTQTAEGQPVGGPQIYGDQVLVILQRGSQREVVCWDLWNGAEAQRVQLGQDSMAIFLNGQILEISANSGGISVEAVAQLAPPTRETGLLYRAFY